MRKFLLGAAAAALVTFPAMAQTSSSGSAVQTPQATSPNSGAGVQGVPGSKNGPPADASETTGAGASSTDKTVQDASKIPGLPGNKSGPPARKPSDTGSK